MKMNAKKQSHNIPVSGGLRNLSPKTIAMIALLAVMGILWGRVLLSGNNGPARAAAMDSETAAAAQQISQGAKNAMLEIETVALPELPGRNDSLSCNFFSFDNWKELNGQTNDADSISSETDGSKEAVERSKRLKLKQVTKGLTIEAIVKDTDGTPFQVFVDGKILSVGSTLTVQEGPDQYVLVVEKISQKEVEFLWEQISVVLKIPESFEL